MATVCVKKQTAGMANQLAWHTPPASALDQAGALCTATAVLAKARDPGQIPAIILDYLAELVSYDVANLCFLRPGRRLAPHMTRGWKRDSNGTSCSCTVAAAGDGVNVERVFLSQTPALIADTRKYARSKPCRGLERAQSCLLIPLIVEGRTLGVCTLGKQEPGFYTREAARWAEALVTQAGTAIQAAGVFEQARRERAKLQALSRHLVEMHEEEQRRIARELHDEASQVLTSLNVQLCLLDRKANDPHAVREEVTRLSMLVGRVMDSIHRLAVGLRPPCLDSVGLVAALTQYCDMVVEEHGLRVEFEPDDGLARLPPAVETAVYRIVQEALLNVARHACATHASVVLEKHGNRLIAMVEDDGIGFDPDAAAAGGRLGLVGMRERVDALGGRLEIESAPGRGARLYVEVPCDA